jgi:hypothetical protein
MKIPFTQTDYPNGYSRKDCQGQLQRVEGQLCTAKAHIKALNAEAKQLRKELKQGGRDE